MNEPFYCFTFRINKCGRTGQSTKKKKKKKIWAFENNRKIDRFNSLINLNIANISETQLRTKFKNSHKVEARNWHFHIQTCP